MLKNKEILLDFRFQKCQNSKNSDHDQKSEIFDMPCISRNLRFLTCLRIADISVRLVEFRCVKEVEVMKIKNTKFKQSSVSYKSRKSCVSLSDFGEKVKEPEEKDTFALQH